jgi:ASCH domain-containing protein
MEFALIIGSVIFLFLLIGGNKKPQNPRKSESDALRIKIVIEESGKKKPNRDPVDQKPALFRTSQTNSPEHNTSDVNRGLIIAEPWIGKILNGEKVWEMRGKRTKMRGPIALIKKGSKTIVGICHLDDVEGPFDSRELALNQSKHQVPSDIYESPDYKWRYAWVLSEIEPLAQPVPYKHASGSVIWVKLDEEAINRLAAARTSQISAPASEAVDSYTESHDPEFVRMIAVPYARDGSYFCRHQSSIDGRYFIESKHGSLEFTDYDEALDYMRNMSVARWYRPTDQSTCEIVSAVEWKALIED